jgi:hypothetical protein
LLLARQIAANHANAPKSTRAVTREGKATVAQNSRKHGLTGRFTVTPGENQEAFDNLFEQFVRDEKPVGSVELELVGILPPDVAAQVFGRGKMAA